MSLVDRAKNILLTPKTEWPKIEAESTSIGQLFTGYAMILAALPAIGTLLAIVLGFGVFRYFGASYFIVMALVGYAITLAVVYLMGIIANALAPSFDGTQNNVSAMKLAVYAGTPGWLVGILNFIPGISALFGLLAFAYSAYLIYLGSGTLMKVPEDKAIGYTAVVIIVWILVAMVVGGILVAGLVGSMVGGAALTGAAVYG